MWRLLLCFTLPVAALGWDIGIKQRSIGTNLYSMETPKKSWRDKSPLHVEKLASGGRAGRALRPGVPEETKWDFGKVAEVEPPFFSHFVNPGEDLGEDSSRDSDWVEDDSLESVYSEEGPGFEGFDLPDLEDDDGNILSGDHVILPYAEFKKFMCCFVCAKCHQKVVNLNKSTVGIATTIESVCKCGLVSTIEPEVVPPSDGEENNGNYRRRISAYAMNVRLVLLTHLIGGSRTAALSICGMLALTSSLFKNSWHDLEDNLGVHVRSVTDGIVKENVLEELEGVERDELGFRKLDVSGDAAWQTGGKGFNSISGHSMLMGKKNEKVLAYATYAKICKRCSLAAKKGKVAPAHNCPKNYEGSSKGMECFGLMECVLQLHDSYGICVDKFVIDDDSTTRAYMKHSYKDLIEAGLMDAADWPRDK